MFRSEQGYLPIIRAIGRPGTLSCDPVFWWGKLRQMIAARYSHVDELILGEGGYIGSPASSLSGERSVIPEEEEQKTWRIHSR
jgi:hypothetical protein